jgi:hypothetical protein
LEKYSHEQNNTKNKTTLSTRAIDRICGVVNPITEDENKYIASLTPKLAGVMLIKRLNEPSTLNNNNVAGVICRFNV